MARCVLRTNNVEEEQNLKARHIIHTIFYIMLRLISYHLLNEQADYDAVDCGGVNVFVNFGTFVGVINVVSVDTVFHTQVEKAERSNKRTDDCVC